MANQEVLAEDSSSVPVDADVTETEEIAREGMEEPMSAESNPEPVADATEDYEAAADVDSDKSVDSEPNVELGTNEEEEAADNVESPEEESNDLLPVEEVNETETAPVVVAQPNPEISKAAPIRAKKESITNEPVDTAKDDNSAWETVEVKARGNRNKFNRSGRQQSYGSSSSSMSGHHGGGSKKAKSSRTAASRKRNANRKIVREILTSVLDVVDDEVRRRRIRGARLPGNKWAAAVARCRAGASNGRQDGQQSSIQKKETTMHDVLVGRQAASGGKHFPAVTSLAQRLASRQRQDSRGDGKNNNVSARYGNENRKIREKSDRPSAATGAKSNRQPTAADQNTAPTLPETLSAVSANSVNNDTLRGAESEKDTPVPEEARSESNSVGSAQALKTQRASNTQQTSKEASPAPPLPTLLSPGNANSASSSVASSLDAPHAGHHPHHHSFSAANENDVGYHLLDVCDRLTRDMDVFMKRRALALDVRRKERGAVLVALQESLTVRIPFDYVPCSLDCIFWLF